MADTTGTIVQFLRGKGLNDAAIAGILGNLQVESGLNPGAGNAAEGAIGIAQWEGSRRTGLQQMARRMGRSETDLGVQLNYLWHELTTSEAGTLQSLRGVSDPGQAATIWDQQYERSSGSSRGARVANAQAFASNGLAAGLSTDSAGETLLTGTGATAGTSYAATPQDYAQALGASAAMLQANPELAAYLKNAIAKGYSVAQFQETIQHSRWWQQNSAAARQLFALRYSDPAEYKVRTTAAWNTVQNMSHQMGVSMTWQTALGLAWQSLVQGWDQQTLQDQIGQYYTGGNNVQGQAAQVQQQLNQLYADYGVPMGLGSVQAQVRTILDGKTTLDTYKQQAIAAAKGLYPSLAAQLDSGSTVKDIAEPYRQTMAQTLEMDPNTITLQDPLLKKALQGTVTTPSSGGGSPTVSSTPLWQFEQTLRSDPRWATTQNARDTVSQSLVHIGRDFGFGF